MENHSSNPETKVEKVDLSSEAGIKYWTERWNISREKLEQIIQKVGSNVSDVEKSMVN